ncbi:MAG TPA: sulfotransferase [Steroidobacteraceae bacterium]|jgi:tetratricopeptide (TPR) repeat protein
MSPPTLAEFNHEIGARMGREDWAGAAAAAAACRSAWPADATGWLMGSIVALLTDDKATALALIEEHLARKPGDAQCLLQRAECLLAMGRREESLAAAEGAVAHSGDLPAALDAVGEFLVHAADHRRALEIYDRALSASPADPTLLSKRAVIHRFLGHFDLAAADHEAVLAASPADAEALKGLTELRRQTGDRNAVAAMERALSAAPAGSRDAATLHFGLAKAYEDLGDYAASWKHLQSGNALERAQLQYDPALDRAVFERIIGAFPQVEPAFPDTTGESPIFILGLPRSGTTLVERIIGNHSAVHSAGELSALSEAVADTVLRVAPDQARAWLGYAGVLGGLEGGPIARQYLAAARTRRGRKPRFSDKALTNFYYCALILRAFPAARIIHVTRHPLASCYAIYKARFPGTFPFAYQLSELGSYYVGYRKLMAHWHQILPGRILDVAYEGIVSAQEATTRRILDYLDLSFEPACLDFHLNPDSSTTASSVQVRQPLYDSSVDLWKHYATELAPVRERLVAAGIRVAAD